MLQRRVTALLGATTAALALAAPAAAQDGQKVASGQNVASPTSFFGGVTAYSEREFGDRPANDRYFLTVVRDGQTTRLPIEPRMGVPFDVDLGPGEDGEVVAVYSRCATEPDVIRVRDTFGARVFSAPYPAWTAGRSCDVFRYDFDAENETRITGASINDASEMLPSIWRDRIAFVRVYAERSGDRGTYPYIYTRALDGECGSVREEGGSRGTNGLPGPVRLDLYGRRLSFVWNYSTREAEDGGFAGTTEVRLNDVNSSGREVLSQADSDAAQPASYVGPTGSAGRIFYGFERVQNQGEAPSTSVTSLLLRHRITTGERGLANGPGLLVDTATDNGVTVTASSSNRFFTGPTRIARQDDTNYSDQAAESDGGALRLEQEPFMGGLDSGEVALAIDLSGRAEAQRVEIDGRPADVRRIGPADDGVFQATVDRGRMTTGGTYRVEARFCDGSDCVDFDDGVYLRERYTGR